MNLVADKWKIADSGVFQTKAEKLVWDEATKEWQVQLVQQRNGEPPLTINIRSPVCRCRQRRAQLAEAASLPGDHGLSGEDLPYVALELRAHWRFTDGFISYELTR